MTSGQRHVLAAPVDLLVLLGAVALFYPRVGLPGWTSPGGDMVNLMLPGRDWAARWLGQGIIPLWNPMTFGGVPFVGAMQAAVFYPPNLVLNAFCSPLTTINALRFAHIGLLGAFTWFFLRIERAHTRPAALLGAIAIAGSAYAASHTDHINQLAASAWLPALVVCQWRWWRTGSPWALVAFAIALALQISGEADPARCAMIDDLPHTTRAARNFGMYAVLFGARATDGEANAACPDWGALPSVLQQVPA